MVSNINNDGALPNAPVPGRGRESSRARLRANHQPYIEGQSRELSRAPRSNSRRSQNSLDDLIRSTASLIESSDLAEKLTKSFLKSLDSIGGNNEKFFIKQFKELVIAQPNERQLEIYNSLLERGLIYHGYHIQIFTKLIKTNTAVEEIEDKFQMYHLEQELFRNQRYPERYLTLIFSSLLEFGSSDKQLQSCIEALHQGLDLCTKFHENRQAYTTAFLNFIKMDPSEEDIDLYLKGLEACSDSFKEYTDAMAFLIGIQPYDFKEIFEAGIERCRCNEYGVKNFVEAYHHLANKALDPWLVNENLELYFDGLKAQASANPQFAKNLTRLFIDLVDKDFGEEPQQMQSRLELYIGVANARYKDQVGDRDSDKDGLIFYFTSDFIALTSAAYTDEGFDKAKELIRAALNTNTSISFYTKMLTSIFAHSPTDEELAAKLQVYHDSPFAGSMSQAEREILFNLYGSNSSADQIKSLHYSFSEVYRNAAREIGGHHTRLSPKVFQALINNDVSGKYIKPRLETYFKGLKQIYDFNPNTSPIFYSSMFIDLMNAEQDLPAVSIAMRNFEKVLDSGAFSNYAQLEDALCDILVLTYEEFNRRALTVPRDKMERAINRAASPYPDLDRDEFKAFSKEIGEVYDFGLDSFHGFEALTQPARPIRGIDQPMQSLLERTLSNLAGDSYRLNCSKEGHLDLVFPGSSWLYENFQIPQVQKDIISSALSAKNLSVVGIDLANFDDVEKTKLMITRGGFALINPDLKLLDSQGRNKSYSIIAYNDHFDNPSNRALVVTPTDKLEAKINPSKIKLSDYKGYSEGVKDIARSGLSAETLLYFDDDTYNLLSFRTIRGGFSNENNSHHEVYKVVKAYKSIWRKMQLAISLSEKGYLNTEKYNMSQVRPELQDGFNFSDLMLNEVFHWREWFKNTGNQSATPVFIDADPFRFSDARDWSLKLDPTAEDGIKLTIKDKNGQIAKEEILPDPPSGDYSREEWASELRSVWGADVYARVFNKPLTKTLRAYNRKQIQGE